MDHLVIVIPAYNEEAEIESVARGWHEMACLVGGESRLVIIDDGSKDGTYARLQALQAELPRLVPLTKPNSGHGATLLFGYRYALNMIESRKAVAGGEGDSWFVFQTDSDGQTDPAEFPGFWEKRHEADVIIGHRKGRQDGFSRIVVTKTLKLVLRLVFGIGITDANTPFRLMSSEALAGKIGSVPEDFNRFAFASFQSRSKRATAGRTPSIYARLSALACARYATSPESAGNWMLEIGNERQLDSAESS